MTTYELDVEPKRLIAYLNVALAQRKRTVQQGMTQYGEDHPITKTAQEEYTEINGLIGEILKVNKVVPIRK